MRKLLKRLSLHRIFETRGRGCWRCILRGGHSYYRGQASWICTRQCCRGRVETIIAVGPRAKALEWWDAK